MKSRWNQQQASRYENDPLALRAYTSRLIGQDEDLVLHGGGNTSVKATVADLFGDAVDVLYVKGSGWDLNSIEPAGFAPVRLDVLKRMADLETLSDTDMVTHQRAAMLNPNAPNPSVEAILHAIIPFRFVDHTHADAVVTITNTAAGEQRIRELYGDRVLVVPYVMPGFVLAKKVAELGRDIDWEKLEGMVLMNHGVFSFADDARVSYERMIRLVDEAETYLRTNNAWRVAAEGPGGSVDLTTLARLRQRISRVFGKSIVVQHDRGEEAVAFSNLKDMRAISTRGPLTPDHVIRTKRIPLIVDDDIDACVAGYESDYAKYFAANTAGHLTCLDAAPRWAVWPGLGTLAFGATTKETGIIADITRHTIGCIQRGEALGGWQALPAKDIFEVEYWELEQAKLNKGASAPVLRGHIALVTGAASGIGRACVDALLRRGACVIALDIDNSISALWDTRDVLALQCDVLDTPRLEACIHQGVARFGGLDIVVSNAGMFPPSRNIEDMEDDTWDTSVNLNLSSHQRLLKHCIPFLKLGNDAVVVIVGSKNVPAPGPGASAYSAAKAGLNQLARVAALELARHGIRVNSVHPNAVFDTGIWTEEVLQSRARSYGLSIEEYKTNNLLGVEITARDVAEMVCELAGPLFAKTTGAQVPVDGGNDRVV